MTNFQEFVDRKKTVKVGVVGFSAQKFDISKAKAYIVAAFDKIEKDFSPKNIHCISGLTDLGIPALAYREALWNTTYSMSMRRSW